MWLNLAAASGQKVTAAEGGAQARNWLRGCRASKANGKQESGNGCLDVAVHPLAPDLLIVRGESAGSPRLFKLLANGVAGRTENPP
jgi:hypothetical protein